MRISIRPNDSGYANHRYLRQNGKKALVTFDGEPQSGCVTADDEAGMIVRYKIGADGKLMVDAARECIVDEVCHGRVEIEIQDEMVL